MYPSKPSKVIDLTARLRQARHRQICILLALWSQYLSLAVLVLYGLLRAVVCCNTPLGTYCGPLVLLWPLSYALLLASWGTDLLWKGKAC